MNILLEKDTARNANETKSFLNDQPSLASPRASNLPFDAYEPSPDEIAPSSGSHRSEIIVDEIPADPFTLAQDGAGEQEIAPVGPERDERIKTLLDSIQADWQPSELSRFIDDFIQDLALDPHP